MEVEALVRFFCVPIRKKKKKDPNNKEACFSQYSIALRSGHGMVMKTARNGGGGESEIQ